MKQILFFLGAILLAGMELIVSGCAPSSTKSLVIMQHPETMDFVDCKLDTWATPASYEKNAKCVEDLKKKGYIVWGER